MSQRGDPFAYTELQNIVDNVHYLSLSKARAHFGIEPLTDTVKELKTFAGSVHRFIFKNRRDTCTISQVLQCT